MFASKIFAYTDGVVEAKREQARERQARRDARRDARRPANRPVRGTRARLTRLGRAIDDWTLEAFNPRHSRR